MLTHLHTIFFSHRKSQILSKIPILDLHNQSCPHCKVLFNGEVDFNSYSYGINFYLHSIKSWLFSKPRVVCPYCRHFLIVDKGLKSTTHEGKEFASVRK